jgi:hypothetical protein
MKPMGAPSLMMAALAVFVMHAEACAECPELALLKSAYIEAWGAKTPPCDHYWRLSLAAKAWVEYARRNVKSCGISDHLLSQIEREYRNAAEVRDNICTGRPKGAVPAEIMPR